MTYREFKSKVSKAYPNAIIRFSQTEAQYAAEIKGSGLVLYVNVHSEAIYGMLNGVSIGRAYGVEASH
jgi:hypothetical protein